MTAEPGPIPAAMDTAYDALVRDAMAWRAWQQILKRQQVLMIPLTEYERLHAIESALPILLAELRALVDGAHDLDAQRLKLVAGALRDLVEGD